MCNLTVRAFLVKKQLKNVQNAGAPRTEKIPILVAKWGVVADLKDRAAVIGICIPSPNNI